MKECDKRNRHISSKLYMIYISSNNVTHPVTKTFTTLHYTSPNYGKGHELSMAKHLKRITIKGEYWLSRFLYTKRVF